MTPELLQRITDHGNRLLAIFPHATERDPVKLCKRLRRIEVAANRLACRNRPMREQDVEARQAQYLRRLDALLDFTRSGVPVFLNDDPRGYAVKIEDDWMQKHDANLHRDMGGYGIIAPDLREGG